MTQKERLANLFITRPWEWIDLPEILDMKISQFGARILELRRDGMNIENKKEHQNGQVFSSYRYLPHEKQIEGLL